MEVVEAPASTEAARTERVTRLRWMWLLGLCIAPILIVALTQDIGAHAYDAAVEHIYRGVAFSDILSDGVLYPRWAQTLHWGLGSPLFTFQPPLPYYGLDLLYRLGVPHSLGWRLLMAGGYLLAFLGAYLLVRELGGRRWSALVAAVAFTYAPYVIRNGLERGSNEAYSMFLYPLVVWSLVALAKRPAVSRFLGAAFIWAACIGSHVLGPLMLAPVAAVLALYLWWSKRAAGPLLALFVGGLLTAFIWAPMLPEQQWVHVERDFSQPEAIPSNNPIPLANLLAPPAVYDVGLGNNNTGDRVGLAQTVLLLASALAAPWAWRRNRKLALAISGVTLVGLFLFFLLTPASNWLWRLGGPTAARLLYRTRLMGLEALAAAVASGLLLALTPLRVQRVLAPALAALLLLVALPSLYVQYQHKYADFSGPPDLAGVRRMEIEHGGRALTAFGEFEPKWRSALFDEALLAELGADFDAEQRPLANGNDDIGVISSDVRNQRWELTLQAPQPVTATLHLLYYPRWRATLDGEYVALHPQPRTGYAEVTLPAGEHRLVLSYAQTRTEAAGFAVSGAMLLVLLVWGGWEGVRKRRTAVPLPGQAVVSGVRDGRTSDRLRQFRDAQEGSPSTWVLLLLSATLVLKFGLVDPQTTFLRQSSTCENVYASARSTGVRFEDGPRLCAISPVPDEVRPGQRLTTTLYWMTENPTEARLVSFVHLLGTRFNPETDTPLWGQMDTEVAGGLPVEKWRPGKLYRGDYTFAVANGAPPGEYQLEVGWYPASSGARLKPVIERAAPDLSVSDLDALLVEGLTVK